MLAELSDLDVIACAFKDMYYEMEKLVFSAQECREKARLRNLTARFLNRAAAESLESAIDTAIKNGENLIVFGSLYLASDARKIILEKL